MFQDLLFRFFQMESQTLTQVFLALVGIMLAIALWFFIDAHIGTKQPATRQEKKTLALFFLLIGLYVAMYPVKLIFAQEIISTLP